MESLGKSSVEIAAVPTNLFLIKKKKSFSCIKQLHKRPGKWVLGVGKGEAIEAPSPRLLHLLFCPSASTWGHLTVALGCIQALV